VADKWVMYAHRFKEHDSEELVYMNFGEQWWVKMHGLADPIVKVELTEDLDGTYYGWIDNTRSGIPEMIQPHEGMFEMQFPYGSMAEADHGRGRMVRMTVKEVEDDRDDVQEPPEGTVSDEGS